MNINFFDDRKKGERDEVSRVYGHWTVKRSSEKWIWRIIFNLFQSRVTDFRFHWKTVSLIHFWNVAKEYLGDGISPPGSTNSARGFTHTRLRLQSFCSHKRMHDWCPWLTCCVILSSYGKHECQICVNIRCTSRCSISAFFFAHLTGPLFRRAGARAYGENIWYIFLRSEEEKNWRKVAWWNRDTCWQVRVRH